MAGPGADDDEGSGDQKCPKQQQAEVEASHELAEREDDLRAPLGQRACHCGEHCERCEPHHIVGDLEHHAHQRFHSDDDRLSALADGRQRDTEEDRKDDDRQDFVLAHRLEDRGRDDVGDEIVEVEAAGFDAAGRGGWRKRKVEADAGAENMHEDQAERQRKQAGADEPDQRANADAAERGDVAHVRDARDQSGKDQRRDDHLDQPQEQSGDDAQIFRDRRQPRRALRAAIVDHRIGDPARDDSEHECDQDVAGQAFGHVVLREVWRTEAGGWLFVKLHSGGRGG